MVTVKVDTKEMAILDSQRNRVRLPEKHSGIIYIKGKHNEIIATIAPWNGVELISSVKRNKVNLNTDRVTWFEAKFNKSESFHCRLTF